MMGCCECFPFHSHSKGFWACLGDLPPSIPRFFCSKSAAVSSNRIVPITPIAKGNSIHPTWDTSCLIRYCRLFQGYHGQHQYLHCSDTALAVPVLLLGAVLAPLLNGGARVQRWQSARRLWPDTWRMEFPLNDDYRLVRPYHALRDARDGIDPSDPPRMGAKSTTTSNHSSTPSTPMPV